MSSSESSSSTTISSKQDPIELEKKSNDKSHSKSKSGSSSSSAKPVHEAETQRVSKELLREEQHHKEEHKEGHKEGHKEAHKEHQPAVPVKQEVQIDKKKKASEGKVWVGTDDHPQTEEVATADMTGEHLAKLFGFKTIKYLVSHDNEYIPPDAHNSFVSRVKYGMSYLIAGLEEYEDKCIRCRKLFNLKQKKTCRYHPGERVLIDLSKNKKKKKKGEEEFVPEPTLTEVWSCCKEEEIISSGCCKVKGHVGMIEKNFKPKPLGEEPLDPQYDTKKISQARKKREAKMEKFKPWQKPAVDTKGVAPGAPAANTNQKASAPKPVAQEEFKLKEKPVVEEVHVEKSDNKPAASSDDSSSESASSSSSSSVSSSSTKSD